MDGSSGAVLLLSTQLAILKCFLCSVMLCKSSTRAHASTGWNEVDHRRRWQQAFDMHHLVVLWLAEKRFTTMVSEHIPNSWDLSGRSTQVLIYRCAVNYACTVQNVKVGMPAQVFSCCFKILVETQEWLHTLCRAQRPWSAQAANCGRMVGLPRAARHTSQLLHLQYRRGSDFRGGKRPSRMLSSEAAEACTSSSEIGALTCKRVARQLEQESALIQLWLLARLLRQVILLRSCCRHLSVPCAACVQNCGGSGVQQTESRSTDAAAVGVHKAGRMWICLPEADSCRRCWLKTGWPTPVALLPALTNSKCAK